jgi:hypothetical protein
MRKYLSTSQNLRYNRVIATQPGDAKMSFTTIKIEKITHNDSPTCRTKNKECPFYITCRFGTEEVCFWGATPLFRGDSELGVGMGHLIPADECPVWHKVSE